MIPLRVTCSGSRNSGSIIAGIVIFCWAGGAGNGMTVSKIVLGEEFL